VQARDTRTPRAIPIGSPPPNVGWPRSIGARSHILAHTPPRITLSFPYTSRIDSHHAGIRSLPRRATGRRHGRGGRTRPHQPPIRRRDLGCPHHHHYDRQQDAGQTHNVLGRRPLPSRSTHTQKHTHTHHLYLHLHQYVGVGRAGPTTSPGSRRCHASGTSCFEQSRVEQPRGGINEALTRRVP